MTLRRSRAGPSADGRLKAEDTTPIVFITAFANERIRTQAMQAGVVSSSRSPQLC
jgi:CheY-like chemotaxis protein